MLLILPGLGLSLVEVVLTVEGGFNLALLSAAINSSPPPAFRTS
jgi:hypothetical protein